MKEYIKSTIQDKFISNDYQNASRIDYISLLVKLATIIICLCTVRNGFEKYSINIWIAIIAADLLGLLVLYKCKKINYGKVNFYYCVVIVLLTIIHKFNAGDYYSFRSEIAGNILIILIVMSASIIVYRGYGASVWRVINFFSLLASACIIIQCIFRFIGINLNDYGLASHMFFNAWEFTTKYRPCGIFSEASHFSEMVLLSSFYYMFVKRNYKKLFVILLACVLSTSSLGIIGIFIMLMLLLLSSKVLKRYSLGIKIVISVFGVISLAVVCFLIIKSFEIDNWMVQRVLNGGSFGLRVKRSFELFNVMNWREKIVGIGIQNQQRYLNFYSITLPSDTYETITSNREFAGLLGYILCTSGILGFIAFLFQPIMILVKGGMKVKFNVVIFLYVVVMCCVFSRSILLLQYLALYATIDIERSKQHEFQKK